VTEAEFQRAVERLCVALGLWYHHCSQAHRCHGPAGLPDLLIVSIKGCMWLELKSDEGTTSKAQDDIAWCLISAGYNYRVSKPAGLLDGTMEGWLRELL
jgi:hypothetical protein